MKNNKFRLLIVGDKTRFIHLKQFIAELEKIGIESKYAEKLRGQNYLLFGTRMGVLFCIHPRADSFLRTPLTVIH